MTSAAELRDELWESLRYALTTGEIYAPHFIKEKLRVYAAIARLGNHDLAAVIPFYEQWLQVNADEDWPSYSFIIVATLLAKPDLEQSL